MVKPTNENFAKEVRCTSIVIANNIQILLRLQPKVNTNLFKPYRCDKMTCILLCKQYNCINGLSRRKLSLNE